MSRIGKQPVPVPSGVDVTIDGVPQASLAAADGRVLEVALPTTARRLDLAGVKAGHVAQRRRIDLRD